MRPDRTIASTGYNGFPQKLIDWEDLYQNREKKYERIIHAEMNALLFLREPAVDCTLYTWPMASCTRCAVHVIQAGIVRVVTVSNNHVPRWDKDLESSKALYDEAGVQYEEFVV